MSLVRFLHCQVVVWPPLSLIYIDPLKRAALRPETVFDLPRSFFPTLKMTSPVSSDT